MNPNEDQTTNPWTQPEIESFQRRLRRNKRLLDAFPGPLDAPALVHQVPPRTGGDVEAMLLPHTVVVGRDGDLPFRFPNDHDLSRRHFRILVRSSAFSRSDRLAGSESGFHSANPARGQACCGMNSALRRKDAHQG